MGNMYNAGARVTRLHKLQQNLASDRAPQPPTPTPDNTVSSPTLRALGIHPPVRSIFEFVKIPMFGLSGRSVDRSDRPLDELVRALNDGFGLLGRAPLPASLKRQIIGPEKSLTELAELTFPPKTVAPTEDVSHLTLAPCKDEILDILREWPALVISAPTSSGKTTWLPRTLLKYADTLFEKGSLAPGVEPQVYCSVPRVIQTIKISQYVSSLMGETLGETCGYLNSQTGNITPGVTRLTYLTHGYLEQLMLHRRIPEGSVIIFDEAHENPSSLCSMLLFGREMIDRGCNIKLVLTSATINAEQFSRYLGGVPVVDPTEAQSKGPQSAQPTSYEQEIVDAANRGRHKKINLRPALRSIEDDIVAAVDRGETPIVFVPGKNEIESAIDSVARIDPETKCLPFHAKLPLRDQQRIFEPRPGERTAIVATNVGGTGLTYPSHVNTVIISDEVKSLIQLDGVDTLAYRPITRTEVQQLLGRIGRLEKDGTAVIRLTKSPTRGAQPLETYIPAEIQNINLATMMLRFQAAGRNLEKDNRSFIFAASDKQLAQAREELYYLGLFGPEGHITELGRAAARLPVDAPLGKLLAKAQDLRSTYPKVLLAAIDIAANMEAEGIVPKSLRPWQDLRASNANSDVIAQVEVLQKAATMSQAQLEEHGIPEAQLYRALDMRRSLRARFSLEQAPAEISLSPVESKFLSDLYCSAFLPWLYRRIDAGRGSKSGEVLYKGVTNGDIRLLSKGSVVHNSQYIVAYPFNLELKEVSGRLEDLLERINGYEKTLPLLLHAHAVDPEWLKINIPPQFREARESFKKSSRQQRGRDEDRPPTRFRPRH